MTNRLLASFLACGLCLVTPEAEAADSPSAPLGWHMQLSTTVMRANQVLPVPWAIGLSAVVGKGIVGVEAGFMVNAATNCDSNESGQERDGFCGLLLIAEAGPQLSWPTATRWSPYLSAKGQWLRMTQAERGSLAIAARIGVVYAGERLGAFAELGPSIVVGDGGEDWRLTGDTSARRLLPVLTAGVRI